MHNKRLLKGMWQNLWVYGGRGGGHIDPFGLKAKCYIWCGPAAAQHPGNTISISISSSMLWACFVLAGGAGGHQG